MCTAKSDLLRLVVVGDFVIPDPHGRLPGRGASLHPDLACLELAERRRAFSRAFRLPRALEVDVLRQWLESQQDGS